jgi:predicted dehydrogenase
MLAATPILRLQQPLRVAFIGNEGHTGEVVKAKASLPDMQIVAADRNDPKLGAAKTYTDYREMLDREKPDVVAVTNAVGHRAEAIVECARRKINVVAEKPLGVTREELAAVKKAVSDSGIHLSMLVFMRYQPEYAAMRELVRGGAVGDVLQMVSQKSYRLGTRADWFKKRLTYGGSISWIGPHMIDLMRFTTGRDMVEATSYQARIGFPEVGEMETITTSMFRLDNGGLAEMHMDYLRPAAAPTHGDDRLRIAGTRGVLEWQQSTGLTLLHASEQPRKIELKPETGNIFVDYVKATYLGGQPSVTLADSYRVTEITIAAQESADQKGRPIQV